MRTSNFVLAALFGLASAEISDSQRETVATLKKELEAGNLENLFEDEGLTELWLTAAEKAKQKKLRSAIEDTVDDVQKTVKDAEKDLKAYKQKIDRDTDYLNRQINYEWNRNIKEIGRDIRNVADQAHNMKSISIDENDEAALQQKVAALGASWEEFAKEKQIQQQVTDWSQKNQVEQKLTAAHKKLLELGKQLDKDNDIAGWVRKNNINQQVQDINNELKKDVKVTHQGQQMLTTVHIDPSDEAELQTKLNKLAMDWKTFSAEKNIDGQVRQWAQTNQVEQKIQQAQIKIAQFAEELDKTNDIEGWSKKNNIDQQVKDIVDDLETKVKVTSAIRLENAREGLMLTSISIDPSKHAEIDGKIKKLAGEWVAFNKEKHIDKQIKSWAKENDVKDKIHDARENLQKFGKELDKKNDIKGWAKTNNVKGEIKDIVQELKTNVKATPNSVSIDETKEADVIAKLAKLEAQWQSFEKEKDIKGQVKEWADDHNVKAKVQNAEKKVTEFGAQLEKKNDISGWAKTNNVEGQIKDISDSIEKSVKFEHKPAMTLTTVSISPSDEAALKTKVDKLEQEWKDFKSEKKIDDQVAKWAVDNQVQQKVQKAQIEVQQFAKELEEKNNISGWAKENNVRGQLQSIANDLKTKVKVTNNAEEINFDAVDYTSDLSILYYCFTVLVLATLYAMGQNMKPSSGFKKESSIEFEVDVEATPKTKKAIKQTLAKVMEKNNTKTTLMH